MDFDLLSLMRDYVDIVDSIRSGEYDGDIHTLDSERLVIHEQLLEQTGLTRDVDMYVYARNEMHVARLSGYVRDQDY